ncbi:MAG: hypothetical protein OCC49_17640 [Fibrobacterales bacterium]
MQQNNRYLIDEQLSLITSIVKQECTEEHWHTFYLIGSAARGELTIDSVSGEWRSDVECYLISDDKNIQEVISHIQAALYFDEGITIDVSISGTIEKTFISFAPKQWLIDAAEYNRVLWSSGANNFNHFLRFRGQAIPDNDLIDLLTNRIVEFNNRKDPYSLVKLYCDVVSIQMLHRGCYTASYRKRYSWIDEGYLNRGFQNTQRQELFEQYACSALRYKLTGDRAVYSQIAKNFQKYVDVLKITISEVFWKCMGIDDKPVNTESAYQNYMQSRSRISTLTHYLRDVYHAPFLSLYIGSHFGLILPPSAVIRREALKEFFNPDELFEHNMYSSWKQLCKNV